MARYEGICILDVSSFKDFAQVSMEIAPADTLKIR